ncbi:hypothetical protein C1J01_02025 [Nonomuraea aridisoli]|uniref:Uncharacterized protein n=1 Tax=Nonomuraea aridisoli TaxID=2070368 RepID=A0A2W2FMW0_9ACTN|nr:hypothetical protein C1J01_02025 [Nonomuraea aridisoli]
MTQYRSAHRCVPLPPATGDLILDVVEGRIMYVEVLHHPEPRSVEAVNSGSPDLAACGGHGENDHLPSSVGRRATPGTPHPFPPPRPA